MFKSIKSILFATDLSENCRPAFEFAASIATRYQATLVLLHVLEKKMPDYVEGRLKGLLGEAQWRQINAEHEKSARDFLIAKRPNNKLIQSALEQFCSEAGIDDDACGYHSREIVIREGDLVDEIFDQAQKYGCDLLVVGAHKGFISGTAIGATLKNIVRQAKMPVMIVPPTPESEETA